MGMWNGKSRGDGDVKSRGDGKRYMVRIRGEEIVKVIATHLATNNHT